MLDFDQLTSKPIWKKFEYFNFKFSEFEESSSLMNHFEYLFEMYISKNYIKDKKDIDLAGFLLQGKLDSANK